MKVFLSHSTKDKKFVQRLEKKLRAADIEPWLCEVDVLVGDDFVEQIERGLRETDMTVLVWSPGGRTLPGPEKNGGRCSLVRSKRPERG